MRINLTNFIFLSGLSMAVFLISGNLLGVFDATITYSLFPILLGAAIKAGNTVLSTNR